MLEALLAYHCAPAFAGIKPANIVSCQRAQFPDLHRQIAVLGEELNKSGIYIEILCECDKRALVIVYRKSVLEKHLCLRCNRAFLSQYGYPRDGSLADFIAVLKSRLTCDSFPHEIGVFLGYPLHDIYCFINHRSEGCLLVGEWRVYRNSEEAERLFGRFKACRMALWRHVAKDGKTLAQIFKAA